jgi:hypothetical protein
VTEEQTGNPISVVDFIDEQSTREIITIQVSRPLTAGKQYKITMKFISILNALLAGFYRSSYVENGVTKYLFALHKMKRDIYFIDFALNHWKGI